MPNHKSAEERVRRNERDNSKNRHYKSLLKTSLRAVTSAKDKKTATESLNTFVSLVDKMVVKGILHRNKAANTKSKIAKKVQTMA